MSSIQFAQQKFAYDNGVLSYRGGSTIAGTSAADTSWYIWKYTYTNGELTQAEGPLKGAWDDRALLPWTV